MSDTETALLNYGRDGEVTLVRKPVPLHGRFAAAIIRGDSVILANMSGAVSEIETFLRKAQNN